MATRQQVRTQCELLKAHLRVACRDKTLRAGDAAPPVRQLCEEFGLSQGMVGRTLRELCDEGLLHTVERVGTFVGPPQPRERPLFVLQGEKLTHRGGDEMGSGFEERIAQLGGSVVRIGSKLARQLLSEGRFPVCAGVFELSLSLDEWARTSPHSSALREAARVRFGNGPQHEAFDCVSFDDHAGGEMAAEYLLAMGHRRIAFLGLHPPEGAAELQAGRLALLGWSVQREEGWASAMARAGAATDNLRFYARSHVDEEHDFIALADESTWAFIKAFKARADTPEHITAAVVANDQTAHLLSERLAGTYVERERWPALVSFDGNERFEDDVLTSLRLPWAKIGREAATLLWERSQGLLSGAPVHRRVAPLLIPRLSCRADWNARTLAA